MEEVKSKNNNAKELPTQEYLLECFNYIPDTGDLIWGERPREHFETINAYKTYISRTKGKVAGSKTKNNIYINLDNKQYTAHYLIWKLLYGEEADIVYHDNGIGSDNSINNLRKADRTKIDINIGRETYDMYELPTLEYLLECFDYNPETGILTWKERPLHHFNSIYNQNSSIKQFAGKAAGNINKINGYVNVNISGVSYRAHRITWKIVYGEDPINNIDHINHIRHDNRICNLRDITHAMNMKNRSISKANTSGYDGVCYCKKSNKWRAELTIEGKKKFLGHFDTEILAARTRELRFLELVGEDFYKQSGRDKILQEINEEITNSNSINKSLVKRNTTGYTGVSLAKHGRYKSAMKIKENDKQKELFLGYYDTAEEAGLARELKFKELKGDEYYTSRGRDELLKDLIEKVEIIKNSR